MVFDSGFNPYFLIIDWNVASLSISLCGCIIKSFISLLKPLAGFGGNPQTLCLFLMCLDDVVVLSGCSFLA